MTVNHSTFARCLLSLTLSVLMLGGCADDQRERPKIARGAPHEQTISGAKGKAPPSKTDPGSNQSARPGNCPTPDDCNKTGLPPM
jgi:hypothetical protein